MVENLSHRGVAVTLVEMSDQVMAPLDFSMAAIVKHHLVQQGVDLRLNTAVTAFEKQGDGLRAHTRRRRQARRRHGDSVDSVRPSPSSLSTPA